LLAVVLYKPWRRRIGRGRAQLVIGEPSSAEDDMLESDEPLNNIITASSSSEVNVVTRVNVEVHGKK